MAASTLRIDTNGSSFDTLLAVYTDNGSGLGGLVRVAANDDCAGFGVTSCVTVAATGAGVVFAIQVDGYGGSRGSVSVTVAYMPPANDNYAGRVVLSGYPVPVQTGTTVGATGAFWKMHWVTTECVCMRTCQIDDACDSERWC